MQTCERCCVTADDESSAQLHKLGFDPDNVRWVVMAHINADHAGDLPSFLKSEISFALISSVLFLGAAQRQS